MHAPAGLLVQGLVEILRAPIQVKLLQDVELNSTGIHEKDFLTRCTGLPIQADALAGGLAAVQQTQQTMYAPAQSRWQRLTV
eukprot:1161114-Pelagomonas_calceolata.AAC.2